MRENARPEQRLAVIAVVVATAIGLGGCSPRNNHTLLVVRVASDLGATELDDVLVSATSPSGDIAQAHFASAADTELGVRPKDGDDFAVTVTATASRGGVAVVAQTVKTRFVAGEARQITLTLTHACATLVPACTSPQTCLNGACVGQDNAIATTSFPPPAGAIDSGADTQAPIDAVPDTSAPADGAPSPDGAIDTALPTGTWEPVAGAPSGAILSGVWPISASDVWAVGALAGAGLALHYDGQAWTRADLPLGTPALAGVWAASADDVWAVGASGRVVHFGAGAWRATPTLANKSLSAVWGSSATDVWAVGSGGTVLHFDGQIAVEAQDGISGGIGLLAVTGSGPNDLWCAGSEGAIFHRTTGQWEVQPTSTLTRTILFGLWSPAPGQIWAVSSGTALRYDGTRWTLTTGSPKGGVAIWGSGASDIWAVGVPSGGTGPIGHWGGADWTAFASPDGVSLQAVRGLSATDVWAVGVAGAILHFHGP